MAYPFLPALAGRFHVKNLQNEALASLCLNFEASLQEKITAP